MFLHEGGHMGEKFKVRVEIYKGKELKKTQTVTVIRTSIPPDIVKQCYNCKEAAIYRYRKRLTENFSCGKLACQSIAEMATAHEASR